VAKLRILLADDHRMIREALKGLISLQPNMEVVGEADTGVMTLALAQQLQPDIVVMDISMPEMSGLRATEQLRIQCPAVAIVVLTRHADDGYLLRLLEAGAGGYVLKQSSSNVLLSAIRVVAGGHAYLDPSLTNHIIAKVIDRHSATALPAKRTLSPREEEVLRLVALGFLNKEVAAHLRISVKTAETHKANAMEKLGMTNRVEIVRYAVLCGWLHDTDQLPSREHAPKP
jgi:two-component system response regulator NreC